MPHCMALAPISDPKVSKMPLKKASFASRRLLIASSILLRASFMFEAKPLKSPVSSENSPLTTEETILIIEFTALIIGVAACITPLITPAIPVAINSKTGSAAFINCLKASTSSPTIVLIVVNSSSSAGFIVSIIWPKFSFIPETSSLTLFRKSSFVLYK